MSTNMLPVKYSLLVAI